MGVGISLNLLLALGTLFSYWVASSKLDMRVVPNSNAPCYGVLS